MGGPPHILMNTNTYGGPPHIMGGPPHRFYKCGKIWGGPPLKYSQTYFLIFMGGPPQILEIIGGVSEIIKKIWGGPPIFLHIYKTYGGAPP